MRPYYEANGITIYHGKMEEIVPLLGQEFTACVTDPPYHLTQTPLGTQGFMGKTWDGGNISFNPATWALCLAVCLPGAHLLAFGGSRTFHRIACAIEDAGWVLRDTICYLFGSGFPKSVNVSKHLDKAAGMERKVIGPSQVHSRGTTTAYPKRPGEKTVEQSGRITVQTAERAALTAPATDAAKLWSGYGSALKPAVEFITLGRKPLSEANIAANILKHGTGALNIDGTRIGTIKEGDPNRFLGTHKNRNTYAQDAWSKEQFRGQVIDNSQGRWPANVLLSHTPDCEQVGTKKVKGITGGGKHAGTHYGAIYGYTSTYEVGREGYHADAEGMEKVEAWRCTPDCPVRLLDEQSGDTSSSRANGNPHNPVHREIPSQLMSWGGVRMTHDYRDIGGASRFFYTSKASQSERGSYNTHATVKPLALMMYLLRLVTMPERNLILDPFCGSGTTLLACKILGLPAVGIDQDEQFCEIAARRLQEEAPLFAVPPTPPPPPRQEQGGLFGEKE